jgi:hypothetical protein
VKQFHRFSKIIEPILNIDINSIFGKLSSISEDSFIEINETHIVTRRAGRGRILQGERYWIIGGICRGTKQIRLELIRRRPAVICENFVMSNIDHGSNDVSDMWRGYTNLERLGYQNYRMNFVDQDDSRVHTQTIERL